MERYPLSEDIAAHNHDFIEMAYVLEGTVQHSSNGKTCTAHAGDYFILDVDTPHIYHTAGKGSQVINCIFLSSIIWFTLTSGLISAPIAERFFMTRTVSYANVCLKWNKSTVKGAPVICR